MTSLHTPDIVSSLVAALKPPQNTGRTYYTCSIGEEKMTWICVKGFAPGAGKSVVDICSFQPEILHQRALAKQLGTKKENVEVQ